MNLRLVGCFLVISGALALQPTERAVAQCPGCQGQLITNCQTFVGSNVGTCYTSGNALYGDSYVGYEAIVNNGNKMFCAEHGCGDSTTPFTVTATTYCSQDDTQTKYLLIQLCCNPPS